MLPFPICPKNSQQTSPPIPETFWELGLDSKNIAVHSQKLALSLVVQISAKPHPTTVNWL